MCFLRHARDFGWLDPKTPTEEAKPLADTIPHKNRLGKFCRFQKSVMASSAMLELGVLRSRLSTSEKGLRP
jgi:hypothetical protein